MWTERNSQILLTILTFISITCTRAESEFKLKRATLHIQPANTVDRDSELSLTCEVDVVSAEGKTPDLKISVFKDFDKHKIIHIENTKNNKVTFTIPKARVTHTGTYQCDVSAGNQRVESSPQNVRVTGLQTPVLGVDKLKVTEGEKVRVTCSAREESGVLTYTFKNGLNVIYKVTNSIGVAQMLHSITSPETATFSCSYSIFVVDIVLYSNVSNEVRVDVKALNFTAKIAIRPSTQVIEGDSVYITCGVEGTDENSTVLSLTKGTRLLPSYYNATVLASDSGIYECSAKANDAERNVHKNLTVEELFSVPVLTITPAEVFEGEWFNVKCRSSEVASERIGHHDVKYSIYSSNQSLSSINGTYKTMAHPETNGNYTCTAQVNNIIKWSKWIIFTSKVLVSRPTITVLSEVILGQPFQIECRSNRGSLPITYALKRNNVMLDHSRVFHPSQRAIFSTSIQFKDQIRDLKCEAQNNGVNSAQTSDALGARVTVPVGKPNLLTLPVEEDITESQELIFVCSIREGTSPITFKWYQDKNPSPVYVTTVNTTRSNYSVPSVEKIHGGSYYCGALNRAGKEEVSNRVNVSVRMARWKKALITSVCLMLVAGIVFALVIRYRAKRVKVAGSNGAGIWSVRPPVLDSSEVVDVDEPEEPNVEYTEVLHPLNSDPARVPLRQGTDTVYSEVQGTSPEFHDE